LGKWIPQKIRVATTTPPEHCSRRVSIGNDRVSEILFLVNSMEKFTPPKFSIRVFESVFASGSQILSYREMANTRKISFSPAGHYCALAHPNRNGPGLFG
jgi:hypothetical protein